VLLFRSLGKPLQRDSNGLLQQPQLLYRPYRLMAGPELGPSIIFRDHELSDRIGFLYHRLPGRQAAEDLIYRLLEIRNRLPDRDRPYLVSIILDGENCWENYEHNGDVFLNAFYGMLSERSRRNELRAVTVSEYLAENRSGGTLAHVATGSWINGDLTTWIGDPEHNRAWEALARVRAHLSEVTGDCLPETAADEQTSTAVPSGENADAKVAPADRDAAALARQQAPDVQKGRAPDLAAAWRALFVAEGSDWFWWYSHRNRSDQDAIFDKLFRDDLAAVYEALGYEAPAWLEQPINQAAVRATEHAAAGYVSPQLTAAPFPGEEWALAAALQPASASTGTMQRAAGLIERLFLGHDRTSLYLRLDLKDDLANYTVTVYLSANNGQAVNQRTRNRALRGRPDDLALGWAIELPQGQAAPFLYRAAGHDQWQAVGPVTAALGPRVLEVALPLSLLGLETGRDASLLVTLARGGAVTAQLPEQGMGKFTLQHY
jgi:hypothetical protein